MFSSLQGELEAQVIPVAYQLQLLFQVLEAQMVLEVQMKGRLQNILSDLGLGQLQLQNIFPDL